MIRGFNTVNLQQAQSVQRGADLADQIKSDRIRYLNDRIKSLRGEIAHLDGARDGPSITLRATDTTELEADLVELRKTATGQ